MRLLGNPMTSSESARQQTVSAGFRPLLRYSEKPVRCPQNDRHGALVGYVVFCSGGTDRRLSQRLQGLQFGFKNVESVVLDIECGTYVLPGPAAQYPAGQHVPCVPPAQARYASGGGSTALAR